MYQVLYVDDELGLLELSKLFLEISREFSVHTATTPRLVLEAGNIEEYDAIISDYLMPDMDGILFLKEIRSRYGNIPFILLTGREREEVIIEALNNGADFYIQKGGDPKSLFVDLAHKIRTAINKKRTEDELRESEERYRAICEYTHNAICIVNESGKITWVNDELINFAGYSREQFHHAESFVHFLAPESVEPVQSNFVKFLAGEPYEHHQIIYFTRADGEKRVCKKHMKDFRDSKGKRNLIISMLDITDKKRTEEALLESENRMKTLLSSMNAHIFTLDRDLVFRDYYPPPDELFRMEPGNFIGKSFDTVGFPEPAYSIIRNRLVYTLETGNPSRAEYFIDLPKGRTWYDGRITSFIDSDGIPAGLTCVVRDITDRVQVKIPGS